MREASELKEKATNVEGALSEVNGYLQRLQDLAEEVKQYMRKVVTHGEWRFSAQITFFGRMFVIFRAGRLWPNILCTEQ